LKRLVREPLVHFAVIGGALFLIGSLHAPAGAPGRHDIVITEGDIDQMLIAWQAQGLPQPSPDAIRGMVEAKVREEVLYREAIAMGLDQDDIIVKRRLAQKMDFLAEDLSTLQDPTADDLHAWFKAHQEDFVPPPRISFHHIYYSSDRRGKDAEGAAAQAVASVAVPQEGDRFMFQNSYAERTEADIATIFGPAFAHDLFKAEPGRWAGPIESGYGWHAVFVESRTVPKAPSFEEVEDEVKAAWLEARRAEFRNEAYRVMREKYKVILPTFSEEATSAKAETPKPEGKAQ